MQEFYVLFSIPANQGIGDLGQKTIRMIDIIADAGYSIWQILPLQMTGPTHSPYQTYSSFAEILFILTWIVCVKWDY